MDPSTPAGNLQSAQIGKVAFRVFVCAATVCGIVAVLAAIHVQRDRVLSAALNLFLIVVLVTSIRWGTRYAILLSLLSALALSLSLPPAGHLHVNDVRVWTLLVACVVAGVVAGQLSRGLRRAIFDANQRRAEAIAEQRRFRDLVDSVEGIVWEADAETFAFTFVSEQAERILGYPPEQWLREPAFWKDHLHPEDRGWAVQFCLQATAQKRSHDFEYRMIAADGRVLWIRDLVTVVVENGRATRLRGVMVDVTERQRSEEALQKQAKLLDLTHDAVLVRDMNRVITYWNRGAEELYGWRADEAEQQVPYELLRTVFPKPVEEIEAEVTRTGRWEGELAQTRKDGTAVVVASRWSLQRDDKGAPIGMLVTNNDITERKHAEQAREEIEERWRAAFESNPTMYFVVDDAGAIVNVNAFGAEQLGYREDELIGQPVLNLFYGPDKEAVGNHAAACFQQPGRTMRWEARKIRKDGTMLWVRETANAVFLKKRPVLLVVCEDITEQKHAEDAARRSEQELRDLIETIPVMVFSIRPDGSTAFVSRNWQDFAGLTLENASPAGWQSTLHPDDRDPHVNKWRVSLASGQPFENEARHRSVNGEYRWFLVRAAPLRDEQGNILRWYGTLTDIEDRKRAQEALRRSEAYLAESQRLTHTGGWAVEPNTREPVYLSDELVRMWGYDPQDGLRTRDQLFERIHPEDRDRVQAISSKAVRDKTDVDYECRVVLPDGTVKHIHVTIHVVLNAAGEIVEALGTNVDVTERKGAEEALRRSEAYLAEAQRLSQTGSWAYDPRRDKMLYCSEEIYRIFGLDPQEQPPSIEMFLQQVHPDDRDRVRVETIPGRSDQTEHTLEYRLLLPDGTIRYVLSMRHPVFDAAGELVEVIGTTVDVTRRKHAEAELERLRQLEADLARINRVTTMGELTASLAHEINQPIAAAVTNANTSVRWLAGELPNIDEAREAAKRAAKDANRAAAIINRIRSLFKKGTPHRELVDINDVINDVVALLQNQATQTRVSIRSELAANLPPAVADRVQLQQVLMNLMLNSIEAMRGVDGARRLTLTSRRDGNDQLLVAVIDSGVGLPSEIGELFDAFFTTKPQGTGMGLAISRSIVESHGGRLWASSNSGPGATFYFTLPITSEAQV